MRLNKQNSTYKILWRRVIFKYQFLGRLAQLLNKFLMKQINKQQIKQIFIQIRVKLALQVQRKNFMPILLLNQCYISYNRTVYIFRLMTTAFSGSSRFANLREKKSSTHQDPLSIQPELKLTLPQQEEKSSTYEPSSTFSNTRTSMRLLKGKIQRRQSSNHNEIRTTGSIQNNFGTQPKLTLNDTKEDLKLVLHDSPQIIQKKVAEDAPKPPQKKIMIAKQITKQQPIKQTQGTVQPQPQPQPNPPKIQEPQKNKKPEPPKEQPKIQKHEYVNPHDDKKIKQQQVEQSKDQPENQNDLVECPEGCGRKFNRKALQKHTKVCKTVFMSKRKQFNSQAKRLTSKQHASLLKQNKQKEKLGKTKGFDKTSDNWKAASQDFRSAIKAVKKDDDKNEEQQGNQLQEQEKEAALNLVPCEYCEKMFAKVLLEKHLQNCVKKKQKQQKLKQKEKKKGGAAIKKK